MAEAFNQDRGTLIALSAAGAGTYTSIDQDNFVAKGANVFANITAITGTSPTLTVIIEGKDSASGQYYTILSSAALGATGFTPLTVYPGVTAVANSAASQIVPKYWRVRAVVSGTGPAVTATISAFHQA